MASLEYRLDSAPQLRCEKKTDLVPVCQSCETCILAWKVFSTKEWFLRASNASQRKFLVGIVKRFNSLDLLNYAEKVLQSAHGKDFTFSRSRISPSFREDPTASTSTWDRALNTEMLEQAMLETWKWFRHGSYWTKANYTLLLLQMCSPKLLFMAANLVRVRLLREQSASSRETVPSEEEELKITVVITEAESSVLPEERPGSSSQVHLQPASQSFLTPSIAVESGILSEGASQISEIGTLTKASPGLGVLGQIPCFSAREVVPLCPTGIYKYKDFIRSLPTHLSKYILRFLDSRTLNRCTSVSQHWALLVRQVKQEQLVRRLVLEEIVYLQGSCPRGVVPSYAKMTNVVIPRITKDGDIIPARGHKWKRRTKEEDNLQAAYRGQMTETVQLEERNIFCGSYNVRVLTDHAQAYRVVDQSRTSLVREEASQDSRFLDVLELKEMPLVISGHAGSIKAVFLNEKKGFVLSASFDLSIRCWNIFTGTCLKIFNGHTGTITCLDLYKTKIVSGAKDGMVKVWDLSTGRCLKTLKHKDAICTAKINSLHIVSSCEKGVVKVWHVETCVLIKTLEGHQGPVKCLSFDQWHLVTGSSDGFVLGWSMVGKHKRCLVAFRHPQEVLYLAFLYLRVISGCADGKIRIFNFMTGTCLKVMRANSRGDPVVSFCIVENRWAVAVMVINALSSVLMFQFEDVEWDYTLEADRAEETQDKEKQKDKNELGSMHSFTCLKTHALKGSVHMRNHGFEKTRTGVKAPTNNCPSTILTHTPSFAERAEAALQGMKKWGPHCPISPDQILLTVSTLQHAYKPDQVSSNMMHNVKIRDAWGPPLRPQERSKKMATSKILKQEKEDPSAQLRYIKSASGSLPMKRISTPFETKRLKLNLKNSLHGSAVSSFIPAPVIVRSKSCCSLSEEKKVHTGHGRATSLSAGGGQLIGHITSSSESIKSTRMMIAQTKIESGFRRETPLFLQTANPYRNNCGFKLLTLKQMKMCGEATAVEYQAHRTKRIADQQKECRKAWLKKIKGLPIDDFTKEGKIAAPELGFNVYV
uniref:F-box domain-containing protein n=1 Tax=Pelodiscus sinensis TaxID=13735 RepID=K7FNG6_PELSI